MTRKINPLILASSSKYRASLLKRTKLTFTQVSPDLDETQLKDEKGIDLVTRLAESKAFAVLEKNLSACVIGSDQVCMLENQIYGKPITFEKAIKQLQTFSDSCIEFLTGLCVLTPDGAKYSYVDTTTVEFRKLTIDEINRYLEVEQPLNCAGSFKVESLGVSLFKSVNSSDPTALMGLPLIKLCDFLRQAGYQIP